ncbi:hypothetical protein ABZ214_33610 [Streptomyces iakyrus]|uniref:hypothetical protein n=1 Tax=Streptomyces iakyrus TaxID=68219 RepID=UPI0033B8947B
MATFVVAAVLAVYHLVAAEQHVHEGLVGVLTACGLTAGASNVGDASPTFGDALAIDRSAGRDRLDAGRLAGPVRLAGAP